MDSSGEFYKIYPWINKEFFENILQKDVGNDNLSVTHFSIKAALGKGENYSSQMIRANVNYKYNNKENTISLIIKAELIVNEVSEESGMFFKEIHIYENILPQIHKLLLSIGDDTKLSAKSYAVGRSPCYLVFEDLSLSGYKLANRRIGLQVEHYQHLFKKLARWHAATAIIGTNDITMMKLFMKPHITEKSHAFLSILNNCLSSCAEVCANWPGCEEISEKLYKLQHTFRKKVCDEFSRNDEEFNVLTHGDLWINNCMFKTTENGYVEDIYFVDYSTGFWGSPGFDISYTLFTSCSLNCQEKDWDTLIQLYHTELSSTLIKLKYTKKIPTLTDIHVQLLRTGIYPAILSSLVLGLRSVEDPEKVGIPFFVEDTPEFREIRIKMLCAPKCRAGLEYLLDYCNRKGLLD